MAFVSQIPAETVIRNGCGGGRSDQPPRPLDRDERLLARRLRHHPRELVAADATQDILGARVVSPGSAQPLTSISSPTSWPPKSLTCLKWSMSSNATDSGRPWRTARETSAAAARAAPAGSPAR